MLRDILTTVRPREDLLLGNGKTDDRISGQIVQYLWPHQLVAVRKVYENYKNVSNRVKHSKYTSVLWIFIRMKSY